MLKTCRTFLILCVAMLLWSCQSGNSLEPIEFISEQAESTPTFSPTYTPQTELTVVSTAIPESCTELSDQNSIPFLRGFLLLENRNTSSLNFEFKLLNLENMIVSSLTDNSERIHTVVVSPNAKHLLVMVCNNGCNYIIRDPYEVISSFPAQSDWVLQWWLDSERILVLTLRDPHDVIVLNPITGVITKIDLELQDPFAISHGGEDSLIPISLDPSLNKVLYYDENFGGRLILWDITSKEELVSLPYDVNRAVGFSGWSPDGQVYITQAPDANFSKPNALFKIGVDGSLSRLTYYDQEYDFANVTSPVWSPDNRRIAFWLKIGTKTSSNSEDLSQHLAVMDMLTSEVKVFCPKFNPPNYPASPVFWSPDGSQLIVNTRTNQGRVEPVLVDLTQLIRSKIDTQDSWVKGWLLP